MGSQTQVPEIPVIDFSSADLKPDSPCWVSMRDQVRHALEEFGCFEVKYDPLTPQLSDQVLSQAKYMFNLPTEIKVKNTSEHPYGGYQIPPNIQNQPILIEGMGIENARSLQHTQDFAHVICPERKDQFSEVINSYAKLLGAMNDKVQEMVFDSYGARKQYAKVEATNNQVLRFLRLTPQDPQIDTVGFPKHIDLSFSTIVHQIHLPGLQVQLKDGSWTPIQRRPSHFVFFAGHGMQAWSNDRIKGCKHQVRISGSLKERFSMEVFNFNNGVIEVPEEMVDDGHPLLYKPFDHPRFLHFFRSTVRVSKDSANLQFDNPLKAFCGVSAPPQA